VVAGTAEAVRLHAQIFQPLSEAQLREKFDLFYHLKHVDTNFERVFGAA